MKLNSIRWRLMLSYAAIALLVAFSLGLVLRSVLRNYYTEQEERYLQSNATRIGFITARLLEAKLPEQIIEDQSKSWSFFLQARVQVTGRDGRIIADSGVPEDRQMVFIKSSDPFEIPFGQSQSAPAPVRSNEFFQIQVLRSDVTSTARPGQDVVIFNSNSVGVALPVDVAMYGLLDPNAAAPARRSTQLVQQPILDQSGQAVGRVILSDGPAYGDEILQNVMHGWIIASAVAVLLAALAGWLVSNRITTPLTELTGITSRMAQGELSARAEVSTHDEIGTLGQSFNEMASRVEEMIGTLRSFVADAAHELHTPLTALQTNLELAREERDASARTRYLVRAQEQSQRLEALVKSLLDLSRIEAAEAKNDFLAVDLSQLVEEVSEQFASRAEQTEHEFEAGPIKDHVTVIGNADQLRQVVINLLENAIKFTPPLGMISIALQAGENEANLTVTDTGIGIPSEDLSHLFERFHRARNASSYAGNGLGLAIVKAIMTAHGGKVAVQSTSTSGTQMSVSLPLYKE